MYPVGPRAGSGVLKRVGELGIPPLRVDVRPADRLIDLPHPLVDLGESLRGPLGRPRGRVLPRASLRFFPLCSPFLVRVLDPLLLLEFPASVVADEVELLAFPFQR